MPYHWPAVLIICHSSSVS